MVVLVSAAPFVVVVVVVVVMVLAVLPPLQLTPTGATTSEGRERGLGEMNGD